MKEKANIKTKIAVVGIIALTLLIIGIISAPNVLQRMGVQVGEKEGEDAENVQVLVGKTFTSSLAGVGALGSMADYTQNLQTAQIAANETGVSIVNIPAGYYEQIQVDASAVYEAGLNAGETTHTGTYTYPSGSTGGQYDMGELHKIRYVDATNVYNKGKADGVTTHTGTYTPTTRAASLDMGATHTYRYVNTNSVPNTNSGTYTYAVNSTGGTVDMGAANTYRYVDATNVYNKGKADGQASYTETLLYNSSTGNYTTSKYYKYVLVITCGPNGSGYDGEINGFSGGTAVARLDDGQMNVMDIGLWKNVPSGTVIRMEGKTCRVYGIGT